MLSKIIKLEDIKNNYISNPIFKGNYEIGLFMQVTIESFKTITDEYIMLKKKVKRLEQNKNG